MLWQLFVKQNRFKDPVLESKAEGEKAYPGAYGPKLFNDFALEFIEANKDTSFLLYYPMVLVHSPFQPTPDHPDFADFPANDHASDTAYFKSMVEYTDKMVGKVLDKLESEGLAENTLVLFVGDNGTHPKIKTETLAGPIWGNKGQSNEYGTHVPFLAYWKGKTKTAKSAQLVDLTDVRATLAELFSVTNKTEGYTLMPALTEGKATGRDFVFCSYHPGWGGGKFPDVDYLQTEQYKVYKDGRVFDLQKDLKEEAPLEISQLANPEKAEIARLQGKLDSLLTTPL